MSINRGQLRALTGLALLSPALRLLPGASAALAGRGAWLCALPALGALLLYALLLQAMPCPLGELPGRALGRKAGAGILLLLSLWLCLEAGFQLRAGAERLLVALFPRCAPAPFILSMGLLCLLAVLGPLSSLGRVARQGLPLILGALALILLFSLKHLHRENLLPLTVYDLGPVLQGALPVLSALLPGLYLPMLLAPEAVGSFRERALWLGGLCLLLSLLCLAVQGSFSPGLTAQLSLPFFTLVRNLVFFRTLERLEALAVALWIMPDFLMCSLLLFAARNCLCRGLGREFLPPRRRSLTADQWPGLLCGGAAMLAGLLLAPDQRSLRLFSQQILPLGDLCLGLGLIPLLYLIGKLRKKW